MEATIKVIGLDGREYNVILTKHLPKNSDERARSSYHLRARLLLKEMYPFDPVYEEIPLPGSKKLSLDFLVPGIGLAVEVQGEQHYEFNAHFHGTRLGFMKAQQRDRRKKEWCVNNGFKYVELAYDGDDSFWRNEIYRVVGGKQDEKKTE